MIAPGTARAQPSPSAVALIPRRLLFGDPDKTNVAISRDGRSVAYLAPLDGVLNLWVAPIANVADARPLTRVTDRRIGSFFWLHNNRHICFFREQGGDENWQMHRVDLETGDIIPLTPGPGVRSYMQQLSVHFPDELLVAHNQRDKRYFEIFRVHAGTGVSTLLEANDRFTGFFTDPQFKVRFALRTTEDGGRDFLQRTRRRMADVLARRRRRRAHHAADRIQRRRQGTLLARLARARQGRGGGAGHGEWGDARPCRRRAGGFYGTDPDAGQPASAGGSIDLSATGLAGAGCDLQRRFRRDREALRRRRPSVQPSDDMRNWLVYVERDAAPGQLFHYEREAKKGRLLFVTRPALQEAPLVPMQPQVIRSRDGLDLVCYLSRPRDAQAGTPTPMVLLVHGGPWARDIWALYTTHQWLANRGYAVLSVNFRGSTGFGKAFVNAANLEWGGKMHDDLIDAVDWAIAQRIADPQRVAIYGASYGGYAALVGATFTPDKFACAIDVFGISNLNTFMNTIPDYWRPWQTIWKVRMGDYTTEAAANSSRIARRSTGSTASRGRC